MSRPNSPFNQISKPPAETEDLIVVALDDYKHGVPADYDEAAGLGQLSTFFIGYRPADQKYYVVEKPKAFRKSQLQSTVLTNSGYYYEEIAGQYVASGNDFTAPALVALGQTNPYAGETPDCSIVPCKKYVSPVSHLGGTYADSTVEGIVKFYGANYDPAPDGLTDTLIYSYIAIDDRSVAQDGAVGQQGPQGYQGVQGVQGDQGEVGESPKCYTCSNDCAQGSFDAGGGDNESNIFSYDTLIC